MDDDGDPLVYEDEEQQLQMTVAPISAFNKQQCKLCLKTFEDEEKFVQDQTTHLVQFSNLEEPVKCPLCRAKVDNKWSLNDHMRLSHDEMKDNGCCVECILIMPERLLRTHVMKKHMAKMETTFFNSPVNDNVSHINEVIFFHCTQSTARKFNLQFQFNSIYAKTFFLRVVHCHLYGYFTQTGVPYETFRLALQVSNMVSGLEPQVQITAVRSLAGSDLNLSQNSSRECNICQKVFSHGLKLCAHLTGDYVTNNKQLFCTICATKWDTLSQFNVHVASVHLKAKPYMCKDCNFSTSRRAFLASHLESSHKVKGEAANDHISINQEEMAKVSCLFLADLLADFMVLEFSRKKVVKVCFLSEFLSYALCVRYSKSYKDGVFLNRR